MTENDELVSINFHPSERRFLSFVFTEVFAGGSTQSIQSILGESVEEARSLHPLVEDQRDNRSGYFELTRRQWRVMYEATNAVIYGLGPFELQTCTGHSLEECCNVNLKICVAMWNAYGGKEWKTK